MTNRTPPAPEQLELNLGRRAALDRMVRGLLDCLRRAPVHHRCGMPEGLTVTVTRTPPQPTTYDLLAAYGRVQARQPRIDHWLIHHLSSSLTVSPA